MLLVEDAAKPTMSKCTSHLLSLAALAATIMQWALAAEEYHGREERMYIAIPIPWGNNESSIEFIDTNIYLPLPHWLQQPLLPSWAARAIGLAAFTGFGVMTHGLHGHLGAHGIGQESVAHHPHRAQHALELHSQAGCQSAPDGSACGFGDAVPFRDLVMLVRLGEKCATVSDHIVASRCSMAMPECMG